MGLVSVSLMGLLSKMVSYGTFCQSTHIFWILWDYYPKYLMWLVLISLVGLLSKVSYGTSFNISCGTSVQVSIIWDFCTSTSINGFYCTIVQSILWDFVLISLMGLLLWGFLMGLSILLLMNCTLCDFCPKYLMGLVSVSLMGLLSKMELYGTFCPSTHIPWILWDYCPKYLMGLVLISLVGL